MDASAWVSATLAPLFEPNEQLLALGYLAELKNFPVGRNYWWFDGMRGVDGKPLDLAPAAFCLLTTNRILLAPGFVYRGGKPDQEQMIYGVIEIRWTAIKGVIPRKTVQKYGMSILVDNPNRPGEQTTIDPVFWHEEDGVSSQRDFVAQFAAITMERTNAARASNPPPQPMFFRVVGTHFAHSNPTKMPAWAVPGHVPPAPMPLAPAAAGASSGNPAMWLVAIVLVILALVLVSKGVKTRNVMTQAIGFIAASGAVACVRSARR